MVNTIGEIKKMVNIGGKDGHMAHQMQKSKTMPKLRRCETCLSYSDFTIPVTIEFCNDCRDKLVGKTEKQYIPMMHMKRFNCDNCGKVSIWKTTINPVVCEKCYNFIMRKTEENYREFLKKDKPAYVVKHK
jgi:hypothetical protein